MRKTAFIILWLYVFTLPWDFILDLGSESPIGSPGRLAGILAPAFCLLLIAASSRIRRPQSFHVMAAVYLGVVTLSLCWTSQPQDSPHVVRTYAQAMMIVWVLWELGDTQRDLFQLATAYVAGTCVGAIRVFQNFSFSTISRSAGFARFTPDSWNANDIALALALGIPIALYLVSQGRHRASRCLGCLYLILGPLAIVLTASRAGIVVVAIALSALPLFWWRQSAKAKLVIIVVVFCAVILAWNYAPSQSWNRLATLSTNLRDGDLNGREQIWRFALDSFKNNYMVGVGAGAFQAGLGIQNTAHNTYLAILVEQGLLGFSVFSILLGWIIYGTAKLRGEQRRMCMLLLVCWAVGAFTLGWAASRVTWFVFSLIISFGGLGRRSQVPDPNGTYGLTALAGSTS